MGRIKTKARVGLLLTKVGAIAIALVVLYFYLKGCFVVLWSPPTTPTTYEIVGDGLAITMIFLPKNETLIWYEDRHGGTSEILLTKMRGMHGTHYIGPLWKIDGPDIQFGWRLFFDDLEPVSMTIETIEKFQRGNAPSFAPVGSRVTSVMFFGENGLQFEDMWLEKVRTDPLLTELLLRRVKEQ